MKPLSERMAYVVSLEARIEALEPYRAMVEALAAMDNAAFLSLTEQLDDHVEGYEGPCLCALCRSYA